MRKNLLSTAAAIMVSALLAGSALAQDDQILKRKPLQQGEAPVTRQEPANKVETPRQRPNTQAEQPAAEQPSRAERAPAADTGQRARKPAETAGQPEQTGLRQTGQAACEPGQDTNCPPQRQRMGQQPGGVGEQGPGMAEQPGTRQRRTFGQQGTGGRETDQQQMRQKAPATATNPVQPRGENTGVADTTGNRTGRARTDVDVTGSLRVAPDKASRVRDTLVRTGERSNVDVDITVGQSLPERVRVRPLPPDIVEIVPEYQGYDYVIVHEQVVIVDPQSHRVVEVIRQGSGRQHAAGNRTMGTNGIRLTASQRRQILDYAQERRIAAVRPSFELQDGVDVPAEVELTPMPDVIVSEVPAIRNYDFFVTGNQGDQIVLVDPDTRAIVEVVQ